MGVSIIVPGVSFADANLGKVTLKNYVPVRSLSIIAPNLINGASYKIGLSFYPINTSQRDVIWSIVSGSDFASIDSSNGLLRIKEGASNANVTIKAVSTNNTGVTAIKDVIVSHSETSPLSAFFSRVESDGGTLIYGSAEETLEAYYNHIQLLGGNPRLDYLAYKGSPASPEKLYSVDSTFDINSMTGISIDTAEKKLKTSSIGCVYFDKDDGYSHTDNALTKILYDGEVSNVETSKDSSCFVLGLLAGITDAFVSSLTSKKCWTALFYQQRQLNIFADIITSGGSPQNGNGKNFPTENLYKLFVEVNKDKTSSQISTDYVISCIVNDEEVSLSDGCNDYWAYSNKTGSDGLLRHSRIKIYPNFNLVIGL